MEKPEYVWNVRIIRSRRKTVSIEVKPSEVILRAPLYVTKSDIHEILKKKEGWITEHVKIVQARHEKAQKIPKFTAEEIKALKRKANEIIPERVAYYASQMGVDSEKISIRAQKTRWGSCSGKGNLNFNCLLVLFPNAIMDSIVVHELCHRKHMDHSPAFWTAVEDIFPNYRQAKAWLKENGYALIGKIK